MLTDERYVLSNWLNNNEYVCPGEGTYSLIWPIRGCAAGQRMVFDLSILNRVYTFALVCPKQGIYYILPVCPNYKQDEICLYSNYTKVMTNI